MASAASFSAAFIIATVFVIISTATAQAPATAPMAYAGGPVMSTAPEAVPSFGPASAAPEPSNDCLTPLLNMSDCLTYVETGSNLTVPDKNCCPELAGLLDSNPICLCQLLGGNLTEQYGISIDFPKALKLPSICRVSTPSVSLCSAVGYPVAAPTSSQGSIAPEGFAASPSSGGKDKGAASSIARPASHALFVGLTFALALTVSFC